MKAGDGIYSAQKHRGGYDAHIVAIAQGNQVFLHNEGADTGGLGFYLLQQLARLNMVMINAVDDLGDDLVLQRVSAQFAMVFVIRKPLLMQRQSHRIHLSADSGQVPFGRGEHGVRSFVSAGTEREGENPGVNRGAATPADCMWSMCEIVLEPGGVAIERGASGLGCRIVTRA